MFRTTHGLNFRTIHGLDFRTINTDMAKVIDTNTTALTDVKVEIGDEITVVKRNPDNTESVFTGIYSGYEFKYERGGINAIHLAVPVTGQVGVYDMEIINEVDIVRITLRIDTNSQI